MTTKLEKIIIGICIIINTYLFVCVEILNKCTNKMLFLSVVTVFLSAAIVLCAQERDEKENKYEKKRKNARKIVERR